MQKSKEYWRGILVEDDQYRLLPNSTGSTSSTFERTVLPTGEVIGMSIKNMFEAVISNDSHEEKNEQMTDGSGLMMGEGGDNHGDLDGLASDDMGGFGDDGLGDIDETGGGANTDELEHRLDELEKEVSSLSSTVSTVRSENEQISESVDDVEENVRKLLDIYEMVTRGVNPFTDDIESGMQGGAGSDRSFGLFDEEDNQEVEVDEDTMNADAEGFFDEELSEDASGRDMAADGSLDETSDDPVDDGGFFDGDSLDDEDEVQNSSTTFQDLKAEYDSSDAEWASEEESEDETPAEEETDDEVSETEATREADEWFSNEPAEKEVQNVTVAVDTDSESSSDPNPKPTAEETNESTSEPKTTPGTGKPYLDMLPSHYTGDLIVMEWLEYLVQQVGYRETTRAIEYYQKIDWIGKEVADDLQTVVRGFDDVDEGDRGLTIDHHTQSLEYISQLDENGGTEAVMLSKLVGRGSQIGR